MFLKKRSEAMLTRRDILVRQDKGRAFLEARFLIMKPPLMDP